VRVTARVDYAVRSATELALAYPASLTADAIASRQGLPLAFTKQILSAMRRSGLVQSQRGGEGGYRLLAAPASVAVADIVRIVEGPLADVRGEAPETLDYPEATQALRPLWVATRASLRAVLEHVTLADLAAGTLPEEVAAYTERSGAWKRR
jgi:Rrf2 family protein